MSVFSPKICGPNLIWPKNVYADYYLSENVFRRTLNWSMRLLYIFSLLYIYFFADFFVRNLFSPNVQLLFCLDLFWPKLACVVAGDVR